MSSTSSVGLFGLSGGGEGLLVEEWLVSWSVVLLQGAMVVRLVGQPHGLSVLCRTPSARLKILALPVSILDRGALSECSLTRLPGGGLVGLPFMFLCYGNSLS